MYVLVFEPLPDVGLQVRITDGTTWKAARHVGRGEDIVVAVGSMRRHLDKVGKIVVKSRVGSFSASRGALVVAQTIGAVKDVPVVFTEHELESPAQVLAALGDAHAQFEYKAPPHITTKT